MAQTYLTEKQQQARLLAKGLGWFSIALGLAELVAPGAIKRGTGAPGPKALLQAFGLREIGAGFAILNAPNPNEWVWARVAGDVLDLATLAPTVRDDNPHQAGGIGALAFVAVATALDIYVAMQDGGPSMLDVRNELQEADNERWTYPEV